jgi:hypothetical protein
MVGDVTIGSYWFQGNILNLPKIGRFKTKQTEEGFDLYADGKLKYRLSKKAIPFIRPGATVPKRHPPLRQYLVSGSCSYFFVSLYLKCVVKSDGVISTI